MILNYLLGDDKKENFEEITIGESSAMIIHLFSNLKNRDNYTNKELVVTP